MIAKQKNTRLHGKALAALNDAIHERDGHKCIKCGAYVDPGEKFHHERAGTKSDVIEEGVTLCYSCHQERHFGEKSAEIRDKCRNYLIGLYGKDLWHGEK